MTNIEEMKNFIETALWHSVSRETLDKMDNTEIQERYEEIQDKYEEWEWDVQ